MSSIGDLLIALGQSLPSTLRKRHEDADAQDRQAELDKQNAKKEALNQQLVQTDIDQIARKNTAEDAATARSNAARTAVSDTLSNISSGDYRNPDTQIEDTELEKEKAITSNYGGILNAVNNRVGPQQPGGNTAANKNLIDTVGLAGLGKLKTDIQNRQPGDYFRAQTGAYSDQPVQKEVMSDFEKQAELAGAQAAAEKKAEEDRAFRYGESEKDRQARLDAAKLAAGDKEEKNNLQLSTKESQQQDKLEQYGRQLLTKTLGSDAGFRLQDGKVNQAIHVRQAMESGKDENGNIHLNQITTPEVALGLAHLVSNKSSTNIEEFRAMTPQARLNSVKVAVANIVGKPTDVLTPEWTNTLLHMVDRQGLTAQVQRDNYLEKYKKILPSALEEDRKKMLLDFEKGISYKDAFGMSDEDFNKAMPAGLQKQTGTTGAISVLDEIRARRAAKAK
jgi:hypothetical protein